MEGAAPLGGARFANARAELHGLSVSSALPVPGVPSREPLRRAMGCTELACDGSPPPDWVDRSALRADTTRAACVDGACSSHWQLSAYGKAAKVKLANLAAKGEPEDQLRAPLEQIFGAITILCRLKPGAIVAVGEAALRDLRTRPDYAITRDGALVGYVEVKAPGKGANPKRFRGHDREQWDRLQTLPNLLYTDGNAFSLWRDGKQVETSDAALDAPPTLVALFDDFVKSSPRLYALCG